MFCIVKWPKSHFFTLNLCLRSIITVLKEIWAQLLHCEIKVTFYGNRYVHQHTLDCKDVTIFIWTSPWVRNNFDYFIHISSSVRQLAVLNMKGWWGELGFNSYVRKRHQDTLGSGSSWKPGRAEVPGALQPRPIPLPQPRNRASESTGQNQMPWQTQTQASGTSMWMGTDQDVSLWMDIWSGKPLHWSEGYWR